MTDETTVVTPEVATEATEPSVTPVVEAEVVVPEAPAQA
jgi:hypothetical protein